MPAQAGAGISIRNGELKRLEELDGLLELVKNWGCVELEAKPGMLAC